ncbi:protein mono-ADP-ribosyltransferase PARP4-like isoform X2 [Hyperolius riggenbachi]|uniref:protein mono-ADP-ribosyltransferase PARP4-like isoform X2 n=1 Tax=Hyperolius riggenbachi TaxID=752182 RepID=UPI0035A2FBDE
MGAGIFSDCVFFLKVNSLPFKEKADLKRCITSNGGTISLVLNEKCTHVVVISTAVLNTSQQKKIQKHSIPIVKPDFIWQSIQENHLTEVELADVVTLEEEKDDKSLCHTKCMKHTRTGLNERGDEEFEEEVDEEFEEEAAEKYLPPDTEVAKYSFFQKGEEIAIVEILCFNEQQPFRYEVSTVRGIPGTSQKKIKFNLIKAAEKACDKYEQRMTDLKSNGFTQMDKIPPEAEPFASHALQKVLLGEALNVTQLSPEVAALVESIWTEALGHLTSVLSCSVESISLNDVSKAEGILQHLRHLLNKEKHEESIDKMMQEFYQCIPHRRRQWKNIDKKFLTAKQDLCQLIRDMANVCETNSSRSYPSSVAKYRALRCRVEYVDPYSEEFNQVKQNILDNNHSNEEFQVLRVFRIGRVSEAMHFKSDLGNIQPLLHASLPCNFVGILSRGLLLPKIIVDEFGLERTDIGNLGSGIYFSDSISTSVKYTEASSNTGARLLVVCDVALGRTKDVGKRDYTITEPPEGFHSIHGVRSDVWKNSDFVDDEYVVYNVNQIKMRYIVQFGANKDQPNLQADPTLTLSEDNNVVTTCESSEDISIDDLPEASTTKGGLQGKDGKQIPLESIYVKARLMDLAAQVIIFQTYKNHSLIPIEAKYVFPLDSTAAVCGFEAFINGKHIVGKVKEKQEAHREYRSAISEGHGAYLMDQDAPDVFTVSVGNLPAGATVIIKITYVTELVSYYSIVSFLIPGTVASWQEDQALRENTQDTVAKVGIHSDKAAQGSFHLDMSIEMPRKIESLYCSTHKLKIKKTDCKAVVRVEEGSSLTDQGFSLTVSLENAYIPRMWVETHPDKDSEACMLIFQPEFEDSYEQSNVTICLDCSSSMESCFQSAKQVALLALNNLSYFPVNIVTFGSTSKEFYLYPKTEPNDWPEMKTFIKEAKPNMGNTEFWKTLQSICLLRPSSGCQKVLLISDGHFQNDNLVLQILEKNKGHVNLFTCGVGATANKHMLRCLARYGAGGFEYFADKSKSSWRNQMTKQYLRMTSPVCTAVSVKWRMFDRNRTEPVQAPANIQSLFHNDSLFVYGFVSRCTQATLRALLNKKELENMVSTTELQKTTGTILHKLTARALIRDYEDGILREKEHENEMVKQKLKSFIIELSKEHSIVTQFTSFIAVEKRSAEESENIEPNIDEILSAEDVDLLPYMDYKEDEEKREVLDMYCEKTSEDMGFALYDDFDICASNSAFGSGGMAPSYSPTSPAYAPELERTTPAYAPISPSYRGHIRSRMQASEVPALERSGGGGQEKPEVKSEWTLVSKKSKRKKKRTERSREDIVYPEESSTLPVLFNAVKTPHAAPKVLQDTSILSAVPILSPPTSPIKRKESMVPPPFSYLKTSMVPTPAPYLKTSFICSTSPEKVALIPQPSLPAALMTPPPPPAAAALIRPPPPPPAELMPPPPPPAAAALIPPPPPPPAALIPHPPPHAAAAALIPPPPPPPAALIPPPPPPISPAQMQLLTNSVLQFKRVPLPPPPRAAVQTSPPFPLPVKMCWSASKLKPAGMQLSKKKSVGSAAVKSSIRQRSQLAELSWSSFSSLQSEEGFWTLTPQLGQLLNIDAHYFCHVFLVEKGISSLGSRGKDEILKLIATLLVLQVVRTYSLLSGVKFKALMKLDQCDSASESFTSIEKAVNWAVRTDKQYPGICSRMGLGRDWEHATRQLLNLEPPSSDLTLTLYL